MEDRRYAVLIDADNIGSQYISVVLDEVSKKGRATIKRIYADWTNPCVQNWKSVNLEHSLMPIQQYSYTHGKNATDSAMIIDAMDILYTGAVEGFCLVSSDSDFTRLAARLREAGMDVIGMGKKMTPEPFVKACSDFKYVDILLDSSEESENVTTPEVLQTDEKPKITKPKSSQTPKTVLKNAILQILEENSDDEGWMLASEVGNMLKKKFTDFDTRNYGFKKLAELLENLGLEVLKKVDEHNIANPAGQLVFVRKKIKKKSVASKR